MTVQKKKSSRASRQGMTDKQIIKYNLIKIQMFNIWIIKNLSLEYPFRIQFPVQLHPSS